MERDATLINPTRSDRGKKLRIFHDKCRGYLNRRAVVELVGEYLERKREGLSVKEGRLGKRCCERLNMRSVFKYIRNLCLKCENDVKEFPVSEKVQFRVNTVSFCRGCVEELENLKKQQSIESGSIEFHLLKIIETCRREDLQRGKQLQEGERVYGKDLNDEFSQGEDSLISVGSRGEFEDGLGSEERLRLEGLTREELMGEHLALMLKYRNEVDSLRRVIQQQNVLLRGCQSNCSQSLYGGSLYSFKSLSSGDGLSSIDQSKMCSEGSGCSRMLKQLACSQGQNQGGSQSLSQSEMNSGEGSCNDGGERKQHSLFNPSEYERNIKYSMMKKNHYDEENATSRDLDGLIEEEEQGSSLLKGKNMTMSELKQRNSLNQQSKSPMVTTMPVKGSKNSENGQ